MTPTSEMDPARGAEAVAGTAESARRLLAEVEKAVVGKHDVLELVLAGMLANGHVLLDDVPGVAKTLMTRSFATAAGLDFSRVQFTPDVLPADITGSAVLDLATNTPVFRRGPIFASSSSRTKSTARRRRLRPRCWRGCRSARSPPTGRPTRCPCHSW